MVEFLRFVPFMFFFIIFLVCQFLLAPLTFCFTFSFGRFSLGSEYVLFFHGYFKKSWSAVARVFRLKKKIFSRRSKKPSNPCPTHTQWHRSSLRWADHRPMLWTWGRRGSFLPRSGKIPENNAWVLHTWGSNPHLEGATESAKPAGLAPVRSMAIFYSTFQFLSWPLSTRLQVCLDFSSCYCFWTLARLF